MRKPSKHQIKILGRIGSPRNRADIGIYVRDRKANRVMVGEEFSISFMTLFALAREGWIHVFEEIVVKRAGKSIKSEWQYRITPLGREVYEKYR